MLINYNDFEKVDLRSGTIIKAEVFSQAKKPAYKIWIDFGPIIGVKQTSAQVTIHYRLETLIGMKVVGCVNLGVKNIAGFESQILLTGFPDESGDIFLVTVDSRVPNGQKLF